jgi:hypothetical protein
LTDNASQSKCHAGVMLAVEAVHALHTKVDQQVTNLVDRIQKSNEFDNHVVGHISVGKAEEGGKDFSKC